jgi:O-antigen/teichoic acid export membrane protein
MILGLMWPLLAGIAVLAGPLVHILYGDKWLEAALPLSLLMLALFFTLCFGMNWELFVIRGRTAEQTKYEVVRSFLGLILFSIGATFGIAAAALGRVLDALLGALFYYPKMAKLAEAPHSVLRSIYSANLVLTAAAAAPAFALMSWQNWDPRVSPVAIAASVALGGLLWFGALGLVRHPLLDEMRLFLSRSPIFASVHGRMPDA